MKDQAGKTTRAAKKYHPAEWLVVAEWLGLQASEIEEPAYVRVYRELLWEVGEPEEVADDDPRLVAAGSPVREAVVMESGKLDDGCKNFNRTQRDKAVSWLIAELGGASEKLFEVEWSSLSGESYRVSELPGFGLEVVEVSGWSMLGGECAAIGVVEPGEGRRASLFERVLDHWEECHDGIYLSCPRVTEVCGDVTREEVAALMDRVRWRPRG